MKIGLREKKVSVTGCGEIALEVSEGAETLGIVCEGVSSLQADFSRFDLLAFFDAVFGEGEEERRDILRLVRGLLILASERSFDPIETEDIAEAMRKADALGGEALLAASPHGFFSRLSELEGFERYAFAIHALCLAGRGVSNEEAEMIKSAAEAAKKNMREGEERGEAAARFVPVAVEEGGEIKGVVVSQSSLSAAQRANPAASMFLFDGENVEISRDKDAKGEDAADVLQKEGEKKGTIHIMKRPDERTELGRLLAGHAGEAEKRYEIVAQTDASALVDSIVISLVGWGSASGELKRYGVIEE